MKDISKMTLEELKQYRNELIEKSKGAPQDMQEIVKVHNAMVRRKNE